ncbi:hypothetical protein CRV24_008147 [Beauveria bassiana]|nr:hypothetical protein CRV24_008147 [Beauveria bassiana]
MPFLPRPRPSLPVPLSLFHLLGQLVYAERPLLVKLCTMSFLGVFFEGERVSMLVPRNIIGSSKRTTTQTNLFLQEKWCVWLKRVARLGLCLHELSAEKGLLRRREKKRGPMFKNRNTLQASDS